MLSPDDPLILERLEPHRLKLRRNELLSQLRTSRKLSEFPNAVNMVEYESSVECDENQCFIMSVGCLGICVMDITNDMDLAQQYGLNIKSFSKSQLLKMKVLTDNWDFYTYPEFRCNMIVNDDLIMKHIQNAWQLHR